MPKLIQVRLKKEALEQLDQLTQRLGLSNRTATIRFATAIASEIVGAIVQRKRVIFEDADGNREALIIPGVSADSPL